MTTSHYLVELDLVLADDAKSEQMETMLDALAEQVADLTDGIDGDVSANLAEKTITIHLSLDDASDESAFVRAVAAARTALHAVGAPTPGWERITLQPTPADLATC